METKNDYTSIVKHIQEQKSFDIILNHGIVLTFKYEDSVFQPNSHRLSKVKYKNKSYQMKNIPSEGIVFSFIKSVIYLNVFYIKKIREDFDVPIRGKKVLEYLMKVADVMQVDIIVKDSSRLKYILFAKYGKTFYERCGFETNIPDRLRDARKQKLLAVTILERLQVNVNFFPEVERYIDLISHQLSLMKELAIPKFVEILEKNGIIFDKLWFQIVFGDIWMREDIEISMITNRFLSTRYSSNNKS